MSGAILRRRDRTARSLRVVHYSSAVNRQAYTNGMESFWAMLKRGYHGTFHHLSEKHLERYVAEFAGRHNVRDLDTVAQMSSLARGMIGKRIMYRDLIA